MIHSYLHSDANDVLWAIEYALKSDDISDINHLRLGVSISYRFQHQQVKLSLLSCSRISLKDMSKRPYFAVHPVSKLCGQLSGSWSNLRSFCCKMMDVLQNGMELQLLFGEVLSSKDWLERLGLNRQALKDLQVILVLALLHQSSHDLTFGRWCFRSQTHIYLTT